MVPKKELFNLLFHTRRKGPMFNKNSLYYSPVVIGAADAVAAVQHQKIELL